MTPKRTYLEQVPPKTYEELLGPKNKRVAVLGAFDTWSYMHKICVDVTSLGFTAVTSRYIYRYNENTRSRYYRTIRESPQKEMNEFLKEDVIGICDLAIIIYSVPAAHYNEADWCDQAGRERGLKTFGIVFVRDIIKDTYCKSCVVNEEYGYSYCQGEGDAWGCIQKPECPFKGQGVAKNQIEYFLNNRTNMMMVAIEKIEKSKDIVNLFLNDNFIKPKSYPYVFEFRVSLTHEDASKLITKSKGLLSKMEEQIEKRYKLIDYYYKPEKQSISEWLSKSRTLRIRESRIPILEDVNIFSSELVQNDSGFFCKEPFGNLVWYKGPLDKAKTLLEQHNMDKMFKVIKDGIFYEFSLGKLEFRLYIENLMVEKNGCKSLEYGDSAEIEIWSEKAEFTPQVGESKDKVLKLLELKDKKQDINPIQELVNKWITTQKWTKSE